jgi:hypothetical protein
MGEAFIYPHISWVIFIANQNPLAQARGLTGDY